MAHPLPGGGAPAPEEWLAAYARVQRLADREILALLRQAQSDIVRQLRELSLRPGVGAAVRREQLRIVQRNMLRIQAVVFRKVGDIIEARRVEAAEHALVLSGRVDRVLFAAAGEAETGRALARSATLGLESGLEAAVARMTGVAIPLSQRVFNTQMWMDGRLQAKVNSALARGLSAREFAAEAIDWINPATPGGVRYAAMRLARTEINNSFHAISIRKASEAPWVEGMRWHLSRSHPKSDDCDSIAHDDTDRLGEGVYKPLNVPRKPHPQCMCFVTPVTIAEDEFLDNLLAGKYDSVIERRTSQVIPSEPLKAVKKAAARKVAAKPTKTPEQLAEERLKRKAKAHAAKVVDMPEGMSGQKKIVTGELQKQAGVTPNAMLKLQKVWSGDPGSPFAKQWAKTQPSNTGAIYHYSGFNRQIELSPRWMSSYDSMNSAFGAGLPWHVPPGARSGLQATTGHEYGHHLDSMITGHTGNWPKGAVDRLFPVLKNELGLKGDPLRMVNGSVLWLEFDRWITDNAAVIARKVSQYGSKNSREFLAEIWSEFSNGKPRTYIKTIGEVIKTLAEEASV